MLLYTIVFILAVLVAGLLMVVILMQSSKGDGLSSAFGGAGAVNAAFSTRQAANALHKITINLVAAFMVLSLLATVLSRNGSRESTGVVTREALEQQRVDSGFNESIPKLELPPAGGAPAGETPAAATTATEAQPAAQTAAPATQAAPDAKKPAESATPQGK